MSRAALEHGLMLHEVARRLIEDRAVPVRIVARDGLQ